MPRCVWLVAVAVVAAVGSASQAQLQPIGGTAKEPAWYAAAVKSVEASFDPAEAKPGQTVTYKLTVHLNPGYHTYPLRQPDKPAAGMVNKITFPDAGPVVFVGDPIDPDDFKSKAEPDLGITELRYLPGKAVFERKAVVSPKAAAGPIAVPLKAFKLSVCDKDNCYPARTLTPTATLTVLGGPPVAVEKAYADDVKKAGGL